MIAMKTENKTHTKISERANERTKRTSERQKEMFGMGKREKMLLYIESNAYVNIQQTTQKKTRNRPFFHRILSMRTSTLYERNGNKNYSSLTNTHRSFIENFLIEGDTSAQFYCRNLFLPINKLHTAFSRETCYQGNLLFLQFGQGLQAIYVKFKTY